VTQNLNQRFHDLWTGIVVGDGRTAKNWPPWSPDFNLLYFHAWKYIWERVYEHKADTCENLIFRTVDKATRTDDRDT
jgi:hypothetical protein